MLDLIGDRDWPHDKIAARPRDVRDETPSLGTTRGEFGVSAAGGA